jgi:hypothetical protein
MLATQGRLVDTGSTGLRQLVSAAGLTWRPFDLRLESPLIIEPSVPLEVRVRWRDGMSGPERSAAETRLGLAPSVVGSSGYALHDDSKRSIQRLVQDLDVEDTAGVDRHSYRAPVWPTVVRRIALLRLRAAPWLASPYNAEGWLYRLFLLVSPVAVAVAWFGKRRGLVPAAEFWKILTLAVLCLVLLLLLIRGNLDSRLAGVAAPCFVLLACTIAAILRWSRQRGRGARVAISAGVLVVAVLTWGSLGVVSPDGPGQLATILYQRAVSAPSRVVRIIEVQTNGERLIEDWAPPGSVGMRGLTRWLHECTRSSDRIFVMGYHPQVFFYAERPFAAGMAVSYSNYFTDPASQRHAISRLQQESVPIVITDSPRRLQDQYDLIGAYVAGRFKLVAESGFGAAESYEVLVDRNSRPVRTVRVADVSLPCFVPRQVGGAAF